jgi:replication-associated recombination protein RarA
MDFLSYDPWANVTSRNGYMADELREGLHKTIRRNKAQLAIRIAFEMYITSEQMEDMLWRRLAIMAVEDVGFGDPMAPVLVDTLERMRKLHPYNDIDRASYFAQAIRHLCRSKKDLSVGVIMGIVRKEFERGILPQIPEEAYDMHCKKGRDRGKNFKDFLKEGNVVSPPSEEYESDEYKADEKRLLDMQLEELNGTVEKKDLQVPPFELQPYFI